MIVAVPALKPEALKQWLKEGDVDRLRQLVTDGQGHRLLGERPPVPAARGFLRTLPSLMVKLNILKIKATIPYVSHYVIDNEFCNEVLAIFHKPAISEVLKSINLQ